MKDEYNFDLTDLDSQFASFSQKGITRFSLHEGVFSRDRNSLKNFLSKAKKYIPEVFISIPVEAEVIDCEIVALCKDLFCSLDIFFRVDEIAKKIGEKNSEKFADEKISKKFCAMKFDSKKNFSPKKGRAFERCRSRLWIFGGLRNFAARLDKIFSRTARLRHDALSESH